LQGHNGQQLLRALAQAQLMEPFPKVHRAPNLTALALFKSLLDIFSGMSARLSDLIYGAMVSANTVLFFGKHIYRSSNP
jgi:hypothetical protein